MLNSFCAALISEKTIHPVLSHKYNNSTLTVRVGDTVEATCQVGIKTALSSSGILWQITRGYSMYIMSGNFSGQNDEYPRDVIVRTNPGEREFEWSDENRRQIYIDSDRNTDRDSKGRKRMTDRDDRERER